MSDERMYLRSQWERVGDFDEKSQSFSIRRIPAPPEARAVMDDDAEWHSTRYGLEMRFACPNCLKAVMLRWGEDVPHQAMSMSIPGAAALALGSEIAAAFVASRRDVERLRDLVNHNAAMLLIEQGRSAQLASALSRKRRKAKQTEAQRRKDGDRRRRNAR